MKLTHIGHKNGGDITEITHIGHSTYKGVATWFFVGDIEWAAGVGGGKSVATEIPPWALCHDQDNKEAHEECSALLAALNAYLRSVGDWHDQKHKRNGRVYSWTPFEKEQREPIGKMMVLAEADACSPSA